MDKTLPSDVNANSYAYRGTVEGREGVGRGVGRVELKKLASFFPCINYFLFEILLVNLPTLVSD